MALSVDTMALSVDTMALSVDAMALSVDAMALLINTMALSVDTMALSVDAMALSVDAMALLVDTINLPCYVFLQLRFVLECEPPLPPKCDRPQTLLKLLVILLRIAIRLVKASSTFGWE
ncbi:hypothetical protein [uncultured Nostoc sp.]|uniref:hypothetical protein n=1 Tax=uncultured Nostoc sp. TaxID=340711 RepID=UPI0035CC2707